MKTDYQLKLMVKRGGPERPEDVVKVADGLSWMTAEYGVERGKKRFGELIGVTPDSLHYHLMNWPKGYQGDFELIEKIYNRALSANHSRWDMLITESQEAEALRGRPEYLLHYFHKKRLEGETFVDVGCGSAMVTRELARLGVLNEGRLILYDQDEEALAQARVNMRGLGDRLKVEYRKDAIWNVKGQELGEGIAVIWCAGVFDYLSDRLIVRILKSWMDNLIEGGEIIVGNMATACPNKTYMDLLGWNLRYRSADQMLELGRTASRAHPGTKVLLGSEKTGLNYFMHLQKGEE